MGFKGVVCGDERREAKTTLKIMYIK